MIATLLPPPAAPATPRDEAPATGSCAGERVRCWLTHLFAGDFSFSAVPVVSLPVVDRTNAEYSAASRAAGCRDLFVIHADMVAGERVIADVARASPDRVLVVSPDSGAADRIAERLLKNGVHAIRALADDENPLRPSPIVSKATSAAHAEQTKREAVAAERRIAALARLSVLNEELKQLDADIAQHVQLETEADTPFALTLAKHKSNHDAATVLITTQLQTACVRDAEASLALAQAKHEHEVASRKPGFFARLFGSKPQASAREQAELAKQIEVREAEVAAIKAEIQTLLTESTASSRAFATEREQLIATEAATRRTAREIAHMQAQAEAAALNAVIAVAAPGGDSETVSNAKVIVGTPGSLNADPAFAAMTADPPFGMLILDRAEELPEAEFLRLARFAERWILVGNALPTIETLPSLNGLRSRNREVPFVVRLAKHLDRETWAVEGDRLICRLQHLTAEQRHGIAREPLADRPEIELRFTALSGSPLLAEIAFPICTDMASAKSFLFHELGEVLLRPSGEPCWNHANDAITVRWFDADGAWVDLEPGVREKVTGTGVFAFTAAVSFDPAAGWDAERAAAWLANHLPPPSCSRFAALPRSTGARHIA